VPSSAPASSPRMRRDERAAQLLPHSKSPPVCLALHRQRGPNPGQSSAESKLLLHLPWRHHSGAHELARHHFWLVWLPAGQFRRQSRPENPNPQKVIPSLFICLAQAPSCRFHLVGAPPSPSHVGLTLGWPHVLQVHGSNPIAGSWQAGSDPLARIAPHCSSPLPSKRRACGRPSLRTPHLLGLP